MTWELRIAREWAGSVLILATSGRIGQADAAALDTALKDAARDAGAVILDLSGVDYLSGAAVSVLCDAAVHDGAPRNVVVCGIQHPVRIALELAGVLDTLPTAATRGEGLDRLRARE